MQVNLTRPNSGRMLDYWLGGSHNFEIDRQLADQVSKTFPAIVASSKEARFFLRYVVESFHARGIRTFIDFGSSVPTCGNTHLIAQALDPNCRVAYSDIDPITVAYGQELLEGVSNAVYVHADAAEPMQLLEAPAVRALIGSERRVGIVFLALAHAMPDQKVHNAFQTLHDWVAPGSGIAVSGATEQWLVDPDLLAVRAQYYNANMPGYFRTAAEYRELLSPWKIDSGGIQPNTAWPSNAGNPPDRVTTYGMLAYK